MDFLSMPDAWLGRVFLERGLAALFLVGFLSARNQFPALLGERGLLPVPAFLAVRSFREAPSLFHWRYSDRFFAVVAWTGIGLAAAILLGALACAPVGVALAAWWLLTFLYLSIVNVGQRFYGFGWESMLVEAGFFAGFLAPQSMEPSLVPILLMRWLLFRVEVGAGLIKLRAGGPWKDLTALIHHHETQPMPNPLSRLAHRMPRFALRGGVVFSHVVQVGVPFGLFLPQPVAGIAAVVIVFHQLLLVTFGNYAWLNWLTIVLAFAAVPGDWLSAATTLEAPAELAARPLAWEAVGIGLLVVTVWMSIAPAKNLCSKRQLMNYSYNRWHIVNTYGAFGSVTKERYEIVLEGTAEGADADAEWREYEFKGKPGDPTRRPPQVAPYHLRLDWLMWFLPLAVSVTAQGIAVRNYETWFLRLVRKLLEGDGATLRLLKHNPFPEEPPRRVRARFYRYRFAPFGSGRVWDRTLVGEYLASVGIEEFGC